MTPRMLLISALQNASEIVEQYGLSHAYKRRDKREPGRREKELAEDRLFVILRRIFKKQQEKARQVIEREHPERKALDFDFDPDDEDMADLVEELIKDLRGGIGLFMQKIPLDINVSLTNAEAARFAASYAFDLIKDINKTSREAMQNIIRSFVDTPGMTIGDVMNLLPFDADRAQRIAVTEITRAYSKGQQMAGEQMAEEFPDVKVKEKWFTNNDDLVCPLCAPLDGTETELDEPFYEPEDDFTDGQPPRHVNCLPGNTLVSPVGNISAISERWYEGDIVIVETLENKLTITPNHPILTPGGWIAAGMLQEGDNIICHDPFGDLSMTALDKEHRITSIEDIFGSFGLVDFRVPISPPDFHGDGANSKVAVIRTNSHINNRIMPQFLKPRTDHKFISRNIVSDIPFSGFGAFDTDGEINFHPSNGIMGGLDLVHALFFGHPAPFEGFRLGLITGSDPSLYQSAANSPTIYPVVVSDAVLALAGQITIEKIVQIRKEYFSGHVYNLQTETGLFVADGIITHNCRCWIESYTDING